MRFTTAWIALTVAVAAIGFEFKGLAGLFMFSLVMTVNYVLFWFVVLGIEQTVVSRLRAKSEVSSDE